MLLIITDQQRADMLSCAGNPYVKTPALDRLAASGVRFERAYCANPVCLPSRFSMMTGVLPSRIGVEKNDDGATHDALPGDSPRRLGAGLPRRRLRDGLRRQDPFALGRRRRCTPTASERITRDEREELARDCADFLREKHARPFLLVASFINPHDICYMAIDAWSRAAGKPLEMPRQRARAAMPGRGPAAAGGVSREEFFRTILPAAAARTSRIPPNEPPAVRETDWRPFRQYVQDHWTADDWRMHRWAYCPAGRAGRRRDRPRARLRSARAVLENDTIVVFTSDHGEMDASHKLEHKSMPYEEATRVPLIVSRKGLTPPGRVDTTHLVSTGLDLIPTLCDLAGIAPPAALKGRSVKPLVMNPGAKTTWRECLVGENEGCRIVWTRRFMYAVYDRGQPREFLADLDRDPGEMVNLAVDPNYRRHSRRPPRPAAAMVRGPRRDARSAVHRALGPAAVV